MNNWRKSIIFKIFLITSGLLVIFASIIYLSLYLLLPSFYYKYKINKLNDGVSVLIDKAERKNLAEAIEELNDFSENNNVEMVIYDSEGHIVYLPPSVGRFIQGGAGQILSKRIIFMDPINEKQLFKRIILQKKLHLIEKPISFNGKEYTLQVVATLQPINEAANVIFMFTPYILVIIIIFTIVGAFFYSRITTKPLLRVNRVAKRMADLDFSETCTIDSQDEIGELSQSLNQLSFNLQKNMTELQRANQQLKNDIQRERELEAKRREFVDTISHELKSPITAVMGQLEAMIYKIGPYKDRDKYLKRSYSIMGEMESLVREVIEISQLEQHDFAPVREKIHLKNLIQKSVEKFEYFYKKKQINIEESLEEVYILADKKLMEKALGNVINNAIKYSPSGAEVRITLKKENNKISLSVINSNVSIEKKELEHIFQPFYRIEKSRNRNTGGSGLGLYIVQRILEMHQVSFNLHNTKDGVEFTMLFLEDK